MATPKQHVLVYMAEHKRATLDQVAQATQAPTRAVELALTSLCEEGQLSCSGGHQYKLKP